MVVSIETITSGDRTFQDHFRFLPFMASDTTKTMKAILRLRNAAINDSLAEEVKPKIVATKYTTAIVINTEITLFPSGNSYLNI
jgi:hypothetical protein